MPTNTTALDGITGSTLPEATTLNVVARNVVASLAIAVLTNVLQQRTTLYVSRLGKAAAGYLAQRTAHSSVPAGHVPLAVLHARALAYHDVSRITAAVIMPAIVLALFLR